MIANADTEPSGRLPARKGYAGVPRSALRPVDVLLGVVVAALLIVVGQLVVAVIDPSLLSEDGDGSTGGRLASQAVVVLAFIAAALFYTSSSNEEPVGPAVRRLGLLGSRPAAVLLTALAAFGLYLVAAIAINLLLSPEQEDIAENLGASGDAEVAVLVLAGLLIVPGAALAEELMFRGFVFGGLRQRMGLWPAALISGLLFGLLHLTGGDLGVALQLTAFGVIMAWAYERSGTLWTPVLLHGFNNAVAFSLLLSDSVSLLG